MGSLTRDLFGGAITAETPFNLIDASDLRQVPDNQEVFLYPDSSISIIVELLQKVDPPNSEDAIRFHFDSLAHDNSAVHATVNEVTNLINDRGDDMPSATLLSGIQSIPKFNRPRTEPDVVQVFMALYRVEQKDIDVVVTFNIPIDAGEGGAVSPEQAALARDQFNAFARSFKIIDYGLFA